MLITTHSGIVVSSDHVACILMQQHPLTRRQLDADPSESPRFQVLLCLSNRLMLVAATGLLEAAARFLRQEIATRWAEGCAVLNVSEALAHDANGAYYAEDWGTPLTLIEGGN